MLKNDLPNLPQRHSITDKFCQYIRIENRQGCIMLRWENESRLRRNFELYQSNDEKFALLCNQPENSKELVQFWIDRALNNQSVQATWEPVNCPQLALDHLYSYCEESCYYAAKQVHQSHSFFGWENYLFIGRSCLFDALKFQEILRKYDSSQSSLNTYIQKVLFNQIRDQGSVSKFSKWRRICKESKTLISEALAQAGRSPVEISCFLFARKYFHQVYQIKKVQNPIYRQQKKWPDPDDQDFAEAAKIYNAEKYLPSTPHEVYASNEITAKQLQNWMEICIDALINYSHRSDFLQSCTSLETSLEVRDQVKLEEEKQETLLKKVEPTFQKQLYSFRDDQKEIIIFYYGLKWKQKKIAEQYKIGQDAISKRLTTIEKNLLQVVVKFQETSDWVIPYINQWLKKSYVSPNYSDLIEAALVEAVKTLPEKYREILRLHYGAEQIRQEEIISRLNITKTEVLEILNTATIMLNQAVLKKMKSWRKELVEKWLERYSHQTINSVCQNLKICIDLREEINPEIINAVLKGCLEIWY